MPKFRDLMHAILNEDVDDIEEVEEPIIEQAPVKNSAPTYVQPTISTQPEELPSFDVPEKKPSIFDGMDIAEVSKAPEKRPQKKEYKFDRSKVNSKRRVNEDLEYSPVISPIFGNTKDEKKQFDKVHDAINLQKPEDDFTYVQVISPMYGNKIPESKPVEEIPVKKVASKKKDVEMKEMIEKPKKESNKQKTLFED